MWFKTRIGLARLPDSVEIKAWRTPKSGHWSIGAQVKAVPDVQVSTLLRRQKISGPWFHLASFRDSPSVQAEIAQTLETIAAAIAADQTVCDLTQAGHAEAWDPIWHHIAWTSTST